MALGNLPFVWLPRVLFYVVTLGALALFLYRIYGLWRLLGVDLTKASASGLAERIRSLAVYVFGQRRLFRDPYPGVLHAAIFWGFLVLSLGTIENFGRGFDERFALPVIGDNPVFLLMLDLCSLLVLIAVGMAAYRRLVTRPARLTLSRGALIILSLIALLMVTQLLAEGFALAVLQRPSSSWQPIGTVLAGIMNGALTAQAASSAYAAVWWLHIVVILAFLVYLPGSKHLHILAAAFNVFFRNLRPKGALAPVDIDGQESFGVTEVQQFSWKDKLELISCTECGRCEEQCPAHRSGKSLSPKQVVMELRNHLLNGRSCDGSLIGGMIAEESIWACTTCGACQDQCPVLNSALNKLVELRRGSVLMRGRFPSEAKAALQSLEDHSNPWCMPQASRSEALAALRIKQLTEDNPADVLLFVGCTGTFDERNGKVIAALVRLLKAAEVNFGVLGVEERCCGDPARRVGEEYLFQQLARQNIETFKRVGVAKVVTACPHCFNTLKNEYSQLGGDFEVVHHTQFLAETIRQGRLKLSKRLDLKLTYHDPCYLGRLNDVYDSPRSVLAALPGASVHEMADSRERSFCCGGGGGHMWLAEREGRRMNQMRIKQAREVDCETIATACPFCLTMLEDGIAEEELQRIVEVKDVAELLESAT